MRPTRRETAQARGAGGELGLTHRRPQRVAVDGVGEEVGDRGGGDGEAQPFALEQRLRLSPRGAALVPACGEERRAEAVGLEVASGGVGRHARTLQAEKLAI